MKAKLICFCLFAAATAALARDWMDDQHRKIAADYLGQAGDPAHVSLLVAGHKVIDVAREKLSLDDQLWLDRCDAAAASGPKLTATVVQALPTGALCKLDRTDRVTKIEQVVTNVSQLDPRAVFTAPRPVTRDVVTHVADLAFVEGLDVVADGDAAILPMWPAGFYDYATAGGAHKRVPKYTLTPPELPDPFALPKPKDATPEEFGK